jgi:hypothetical protein
MLIVVREQEIAEGTETTEKIFNHRANGDNGEHP